MAMQTASPDFPRTTTRLQEKGEGVWWSRLIKPTHVVSRRSYARVETGGTEEPFSLKCPAREQGEMNGTI